MTTADGQQQVRPEQPGAVTLPGPSRWALDPARSSVTLRHKTMWGLVTVRGAFGDLAGQAEIGADGSARGRLEIGAASLDTGNAKRDKHLRSADFFGADAHPRIVAVLDRAVLHRDELHRADLAAGATVTVTGQLTVAGITRPLTFTATLAEVTESAVTVRAEAEVDRGQFDMTWNQLGMLRGPARVSVLARFTRA